MGSSSLDPLGDTLGALGLFAQAFVACTRGFELWQRGGSLAEEATFVQIKMGMLSASVKAWSCGWGIESNAHAQNRKFVEHAELAANCMDLIAYQMGNLETLDEDFPSLKLNTERPVKGAMFEFLASLADRRLRRDLESLRHRKGVAVVEDKVTARDKLKWGWQDGKVMKRLTIIESLINGLYQLLPPPMNDQIATVVFNPSLASMNTNTLDAVSAQSDDMSLHSSLAWLKSTIIKFDTRSAFIQDKAIQKPWTSLSKIRKPDSRNSRAVGTYEDTDVLIEWKIVPAGRSLLIGNMIDKQIKDVARLLQSDLKPEELRTLSCIGVVEKIDEDQTQYGLLYSLPAPSTSFSLRDVLEHRKDLYLGDYFVIAKVLAKAMLCLHLAGWIHKGIRSDNVLFFANRITEILPSRPYIVGFDYSRPSATNGVTEELADDQVFNLYRHPSCQGVPTSSVADLSATKQGPLVPRSSYHAKFDIYSFGVILIELGLQRTISSICKKLSSHNQSGKHSAQKFQTLLVDLIAPELGRKMGKLYQDATLLCLIGNFDTTMTLEASFYVEVVKKLESCNV